MRRKLIIFCIVITGLYISCGEDNVSSLKMGEDYIDGESGIVLFDNLSVELSTVIIDSIQTSNSGVALVGNYQDSNFGNIESQAVYRLNLPSSSFEDDDVFDSITLCLQHNNFYLGDTGKVFSLQVHELTTELATYMNDLNQDNFYNTTTVSSEEESLGQIEYYPTPNKTDKKDMVEFKLNDEFGLKLFNLFIDNYDEASNLTKFYEYFNGIVLKGDVNIDNSSMGGAIMGYTMNDSCMCVKMYYHRMEGHKEELEAVFSPDVSQYQFNSFSVDRSSTLLSSLIEQYEDIPSTKTNNESYIQGGTGLMTKIGFPDLKNDFKYELLDQIIRAELILIPTDTAKKINDSKLPSSLTVYLTDKNNRNLGALTSSDGSLLTLSLVQDIYGSVGRKNSKYYSGDVTQYVVNEFLDGYFDPDFGFLIGLPSLDEQGSVKSLIIGGEDNADYTPKLKLYTYYY